MLTKHQLVQQKKLVSTYANRGLTFVKGEDVYLIDEKGNKYLDMTSNYGVNVLGYSNQDLKAKLYDQIDRITTLHCSFNNDTRANATKKLISSIKKTGLENLSRVYWSNSGAEAVEAAMKFAIVSTGKTKFLSAEGGYHGKTFGALSMTTSGQRKYQKPFKNILLEVDQVEFNNIKSLEEKISNEYAAYILEPIQGEAGIIVPTKEYMLAVSEICKKHEVLLIVDEIQTGMGRTGTLVNIQQYANEGFECDILCLAKGLGGGIPVGATLITEELNKAIPKGIHTSTFGGNPISLAGVEATLDYINNSDILENSKQIGEYFLNELNTLKSKYPEIISEITGQGLMIGVQVTCNPIEIIKKLQIEKILAAPTSGDRFRFLPPLTIKKEHVDKVIETLTQILQTIT